MYVHEGDLWRDGVRLTDTVEAENHPSCVVDLVYEREGWVWRYPGERLFEGRDPALHEDGRIAYTGPYQAVSGVYVDGALLGKPAYAVGFAAWGDRLYFSGSTAWGWWDGSVHWSERSGVTPCWTPDGVYYAWGEEYPVKQWNIYKDGELVIENAWQPAW